MIFVLFGATGDLAKRKIMPALCALFQKNLLLPDVVIVAYSRRVWTDSDYRSFIRPALQTFSDAQVHNFLQHVVHIEGAFDDPAGFLTLKEKVSSSPALYYLAVTSKFQIQIIERLGAVGLGGKLLVEKPFGRGLVSAQTLEDLIETYFSKEDIYIVDHYLGKEGLAAVSVYREEYLQKETRLPKEYIASVIVRLLEHIDIQDRGGFYDSVGALLDVGQSHLLEMLATLLVEGKIDRESIPQARAIALRGLRPFITTASMIRGQYEGYRDEKNVPKGSQTETYFKITAQSVDSRWEGVPLVLEAGKALAGKRSEIEIRYSDATQKIFPMTFSGEDTSYETILRAAFAGDKSYFVSFEEILASWGCIMPISEYVKSLPLVIYKKGAVAVAV